MRTKLVALCHLLLFIFVVTMSGCGSSSGTKEVSAVPTLQPSSPEFPNAGLLVSADSLQKSLGKKGLVVIDARMSGYENGHIPGAINMKYDGYFTPGVGLLPVATLESKLGQAGLTRDATYVIYDDTTASFGAAGRVFWMLEYLGCTDVHILDGGWDKWSADNRPTETKVNVLPPASFVARIQDTLRTTKEHIRNNLRSSNFAIVDARADEEYIGWQRYNEPRGGHIPGAVQIPYEWYFKEDKTVQSYAVLKTMFESRGVTQDKEVTAYCTVGIRSGFTYFVLRLLGYSRASNYDASIVEWAADPSLPMAKMPNYQALVYPRWVRDLIEGKNPPTYPRKGYVILYTTWTARYYENRTDYVGTNYETGHIPGAIFLDTYGIENGPNSEYGDGYKHPSEGNAKPIPQLQQLFASLGISKDTTVVVYADDEVAMMTAGRVAWALLLSGVDDVRILNGGFAAWVKDGGPVETTPRVPSPVVFGNDPGNPQYLATMEDVRRVVNGIDVNTVIADDRAWEEYIGDSNSYYHYFFALGRIPGARWIGDWVELTRPDFQSLRTYTEVEQRWRTAGFTPLKKMYFYCGTGWRSGLYTFYAYLLGWPAANYDGSWFEWSYYPNNPIETGIPQ